ncbi:biotin/lipoyl-binding protein [Pleurocapsa sp. PCC 7327]|uniref:biotin/lipoyl-binding protein n=1 Tax=Pleurocapsa sp. PCC 7327 TaxID=118163 RepID=UPI0002D66440|nr:biotin/lipoyl-binding protein [Pleurocapsa sp. PCC 7327]
MVASETLALLTETPLFKPRSARRIVLGITTVAAIASSTLVFVVARHLLSAQVTKSSSPSKTLVAVKRSSVDAVAAQGRLEPQGEVINLSAPNSSESVRVDRMLVKVGDKVKAGETIAILDNRDRLEAALKRSRTQVRVARARLAKIQAGAKKGAIEAQKANINGIEAELQGQINSRSSS